jgi:hypothetical protein
LKKETDKQDFGGVPQKWEASESNCIKCVFFVCHCTSPHMQATLSALTLFMTDLMTPKSDGYLKRIFFETKKFDVLYFGTS